jgi:hypothetical protein
MDRMAGVVITASPIQLVARTRRRWILAGLMVAVFTPGCALFRLAMLLSVIDNKGLDL